MYTSVYETVNQIEDLNDRLIIQMHLAQLEERCRTMQDERDYLRNQVSLALRSVKFDLHPEIQ